MAISKKPYFVETVIQIDNSKFRICADEYIYAAGEECIASTHNHALYEIRYFASGSGEIVIDNQIMNISLGELYVIHPNEYHYQENSRLEENTSQYSFRFAPIPPLERASNSQKRAYEKLMEVLSNLHHISDNELAILPYFERLAKEIKEKRYGHIDCTTALLTFIMTEILRRSNLDDRMLGMTRTRNFFTETDIFFSNEYMKKVTLSDYAKHLNISTRHASRIIRKLFGMSFTEKLTETRVEHAKVEIAHSNHSLGEIAAKCGFQSYGYFITCFKNHAGMTPAQYRSKNQ